MSEYPVVPLGHVAAVRSGYAFKSSDWQSRGIRVVKIANVKSGRLEMAGCSFVNEATAKEAAEFRLAEGDILISMTGYIGEVARVRAADLPALLNQRVGRFAVRDSKRLDIDFLYNLLTLSSVRAEIEGLGYGSAQPNVSPALIGTVKVPLPPMSAQKGIASILGALDDKIELNRRMNETLEAMARAIFQDWFVAFGPTRAKMEGRPPTLAPDLWALFPDRLDAEGKPEGWTSATLGEVAASEGRSCSPDEIAAGTPYIALDHMPRRQVALDDWGTADHVESGKLRFQRGEFLFGKLRPYFHKVGIAPIDGVCTTDAVVIRPAACALSAFVLMTISSAEFVDFTDRGSTGTKMPRTSWSQMKRFALTVPQARATEAFEALAGPMLNRIIANIHEARTLAATRDLLLPRLMSGELRVRDAEPLVAEVA